MKESKITRIRNSLAVQQVGLSTFTAGPGFSPWLGTEVLQAVRCDQTKKKKKKICSMASGPITSWEIDGETVERVSDFILGGSKITADGDCSHEIKRRLLLGRKVMNNLDSILKSRDITLATKVRLVKAMVFPVVMYICDES